MSHHFAIRVYYEDTDMGGIVYHANYLKFIERARSDWVRDMGIDQNAMREDGIVFAVRRIECDYLMAARFDDRLEVRTTAQSATAARLVMEQQVWRGKDLVFSATVTVVCIGSNGQPARLPANIRRLLH
ncbi:tol-pal system-associated acyl-CoA thioesterase [Pseudohalocynthiibacter aestuariivivens]|uniref:Tol-pal system-associated acyl-CoA thioesterase n=1 Tax=Roseovarius pelagicus TaxID=2980108 RepID=A0ABY6DEZ3_9RHOB|nr:MULTISPECIES: tol-pal system-associated acyl-CoA thioesterase [Rhodobacterales]QIE46743.1 tol-pal system-associated acyl-CoA thioesterase [Pseudohalocynthiibacter aestuariivivens]UXX84719.1 tol-pal system-associated acyl-CoA thioesterase [Roseovarius pelagicus]